MKKNLLYIPILFFVLSIFHVRAIAGDIKYKVADIPKTLLKDAKAVVRSEDITVEIKSDEKVVERVKYAITILNKNADQNAVFMQSYTPDMKVSGIKAKMYDESGEEIKKKGGFDILDYALIPEGTTFADYRVKGILPEHYTYPYTIEYTYEVSYLNVIQFPGWHPVSDFNIAIERSNYTLQVSKGANCRYFEQNINSKPVITENPESTWYAWELDSMPAIRKENFCPPLDDISPVVLIAPTRVLVEGYEGKFDSWQGLGQWINQLNKGKSNLSDETKAKIRKMTEGITDDRKKIKLLYEYMQDKTRYVSVQVGIGSFQPFDASRVDRLSYGDCKALSNYMKSLLEAAGITSLYTLVQAGTDKPTVKTNFPSNQFNHAILCVPLTTDTVWLECTSQRNPFNYMGTFTADREVLVITEDGGKLIHTPSLTSEKNLKARKTSVKLDETGSGMAEVATVYHGVTYDAYGYILANGQDDRKKLITRKIHIPNFELLNFDIKENKSELPSVTENLSILLANYCTKVGEKLMLSPNIMSKLDESPFQSTERTLPISFTWPVNESDTVVYTLPSGYTLDKIPAKIKITSDFGRYTSEVTKTGNTILYVRNFVINQAEYSSKRYDEIAEFIDKIMAADEIKVMLTK